MALSNFNMNSSSGWTENGIKFDGVDDFGTISSISSIIGSDLTVSTRIYSEQSNNYRGIFGNHYGTTSGIEGTFAQYENGLMRIGYNDNIVNLDASLVTGKYVTLTVQMGPTVGMRVYIDGNFVGESKVESIPVQGFDTLWLGRALASPERYFVGTMNNFLVYDRLLTDEEIRQIYEVDQITY